MPEKMDALEAELAVANTKQDTLEDGTLISPKRLDSVSDTIDALVNTLTLPVYLDEDNRDVAYDAVSLINTAVKKLQAIEQELFLKV